MHIRLLLSLILIQLTAAVVLPSLDPNWDTLSSDESVAENPVKKLPRSGLAPIYRVNQAVKNRYIVVYNDEASEEDVNSHNSWISAMAEKRDSTSESEEDDEHALEFFTLSRFRGYLGWFLGSVLQSIQESPQIKYVEEDARVQVHETTEQKDATWGISRISHRGQNKSSGSYIHDPEGGRGVTAYVVDTGVRAWDSDFEGRAKYLTSFAFPYIPVDIHGHGTHVAGTIGSKTYGVAKKVEIVGVGVLGPSGSGRTSDIIKGIEYAVQQHNEAVKEGKKGFKGSTINLSIGGGALNALDAASNAAVDAGIHVVVAAGNENDDSCLYLPSRSSKVITVGATDENDERYNLSNFGKCVDINAPGVDVESIGLAESPTKMTGTSMASPHIAGLVAYFLSLHPDLNSEFGGDLVAPKDMKSRLIDYATRDVILGLDLNTVNILGFNGAKQPGEFWE